MADQTLLDCLKLALKNEVDVETCELTISKNYKNLGHTGNITPVSVIKKTENYEKNLIIKWHQDLQITTIPVREIFNQEMFIYTTIQEVFKKLRLDFGVSDSVLLPHCYTTSSTPTYQALVFDNLEKQNFRLHNQSDALDLQHVRLVLEAYGRWHGLSFALKVLRPNEFDSITKTFINMFPYVLKKANRIEGRQKDFKTIKEQILTKEDENVLKFLKFSDAEIEYALTEMHLENKDYHVITHGDCWINNFLFSYRENLKEPKTVKIIDWQCSGLTSPIFDLSHFIYSCTATSTMKDVSVALSIYYYSMLKLLELFKLNIEEIFPFEELKKHWKKFSHYGLLLSSRIIKDSLSGGQLDSNGEFLLSEAALKKFSERVRNNFVHYAHNQKHIK